jgi:hypothetical protein
MPTYVSLFNWTDQGIRNVRDTMQRYDRSQELQDKHGVRLEHIYWTVGPYDLVAVAEASDEDSVPPRAGLCGEPSDHHAAGIRSRGDERDHRKARLTDGCCPKRKKGAGCALSPGPSCIFFCPTS